MCSLFYFLTIMSNIQKRFEDSLEQMVRHHLKGNRTKKLWELYPTQDWKVILKKLRLVLSWVMGPKASESPNSIPDRVGEKTSQHIWTIISEGFFLKVLRGVELEFHDDVHPLNNVISPPRCQKPLKFGILTIFRVFFRFCADRKLMYQIMFH